MEICSFDGGDFKTVFSNDRWKIGLLRRSERFSHPGVFERHLCTEEAFALLSGTATFYVKNGECISSWKMEPGCVYVAARGEWHHIVVSEDATVIVIENSDTSKENTEKMVCPAEG